MKAALKTATALCKEFEGIRLHPYLCPARVPTLGYGTVYKPDGSKVKMSDAAISLKTAESWLANQLERECLPAAIRLSPTLVSREETLGAIADFIYNLGTSRYKTSTLRRRINDQDWNEARYEINRWVRANGAILRGLQRRRQAEAAYL
jgi:lysozyme